MTSYEAGYFSDFDPADPLGGIDHARVCENVLSALMAAESFNDALAFEQGHQIYLDKTTYEDLVKIGSFLIPLEQYRQHAFDDARLRTYVTGVLIALKAIDAITESIELDPKVFRDAWHNNGFVKVVDISAPMLKDKTDEEKHDAVGDGVVAAGIDFLGKMKPDYQKLIDDVSDQHKGIVEPNLFKASYGYVLGSAMDMLSRLVTEVEYQNQVAKSDVDKELDLILEDPIPVNFASDEIVADILDTDIFFSELDSGVEVFLGKKVDEYRDRDDELVETLQTLALVQYPNDFGNGALDQNGESFFYGEILGLALGGVQCEILDVDFDYANRRWRKDGSRSRLSQLAFLPEGRMPDVDKAVMRVLVGSDLSPVMCEMVDKLSLQLEHDEDEATAFRHGFHYVSESYKKTLRGCIDARISLRVRQAVTSLDDELLRLLAE